MTSRDRRHSLERIEIPDENGARDRAWQIVRAGYAERERVPRERHTGRLLPAFAALLALIAASLSPPGRAVLREVRETIGIERAAPALFSLPADGRLLVEAGSGTWLVQPNGSKRLLGPYRDASWSPFGRFVIATRQNELVALEPDGEIRWSLARPSASAPRWGGSRSDTRIGYLDRSGLRIVAGDGSDDRSLAPAESGPLAWRPGSGFRLAYLSKSELRVQDAETGRVLSRARSGAPFRALELSWSRDGRRALVVHPSELLFVDVDRDVFRSVPFRNGRIVAASFSPDGRRVAVLRTNELLLLDATRPGAAPRRLFAGPGGFTDLAWSPDGRWLLVAWRDADQWVFVSAAGRRRIEAVSNISEQFRSRAFPTIGGWCCAP